MATAMACSWKIGLERGMPVGDRLEPTPAHGVGMDESGLDRSGTDERHLHHEIVQPFRLGLENRRDLGAALDLKGPDGVSPRDHLVGRGVVGGKAVHLRTDAAATLDDVERSAHQREAAQAKEIKFGNPDRVEVVLVELNDGAAHRGVLDRQPIAQGRRGQHEPAHVSGAEPREMVAPLHDREDRPTPGLVERNSELLCQRVVQVRGPLGSLVLMEPLGELEGELRGIPQDPHGI
jgi:hypothetical protein